MITGFIGNSVVNETQNINLTCVVFGLPEPAVKWSRFDFQSISTDSSKFITYTSNSQFQTGGVEVQSTLQISSVDGNDTGNYTCTAVNQPHGPGTPSNSTSSMFSILVQSKLQVNESMTLKQVLMWNNNVDVFYLQQPQ